MKRFLFLSLCLSALVGVQAWLPLSPAAERVSFAQADTTGWERMQRVKGDGSTQKGWSLRSTDKYPHNQAGNIAFQNAVNAGQIGIVLVDPTGTVTMPASVTGAAGPGWASARYSYIYNQLGIETTSDVVGVKVERWDGVTLLGSSPDLGGVSSNAFMTPVAQTGQGDFVKIARATWMPSVSGISLKLTFKRSTGELYSQYLTPMYGASLVPLFTITASPTQFAFQIVSYSCQTGVLNFKFISPDASSVIAWSIPGLDAKTTSVGIINSFTLPSDQKVGGIYQGNATQNGKTIAINFTTSCDLGTNPTTPDPPSTTTQNYSRVLVIGNSILHNTWSGKSWGMAASSAQFDFFHLLTAKFQAVNPACEVREIGDSRFGLTYGIVEGSHWEEFYYKLNDLSLDQARGGLDRYQPLADWKADLIVVELGDNITDNTHDLATNYVSFINKVKSSYPAAKVIVCTPIITSGTTADILATAATAQGWSVASMAGITGATSGDFSHPNDAAMQTIADRIWAKVPTATTPVTNPPVVTPPVTTTTTAGLVYNYPVPSSSMAWTGYNSDVLTGKTVGETIRLESDRVIVESRKNYGGAIQIIDKATNQKLVSWTDWGRQNETALYSGPSNFSKGGWDEYDGIGWNPLLVGDVFTNKATLMAVNFVTGNDGKQRLYTKTQGINFATNGIQMEVYFERWIALTGGEIDVYSRQTFFRSDKTYYEARLQEYPTMMRPGKNNVTRYYTGNAPYTNAGVTQTLNRNADGSAFGGGNFTVSEPWVATEQDGAMIFLNTERMGTVTTTVYRMNEDNGNHEGNFQATYNNSENVLTLDPDGVWYHHYGFYVTNNFNEGRAWANARPRLYGDQPDFTFSKDRQDWYVSNGYDPRPPYYVAWEPTFVPSHDENNPISANNLHTAFRSSLNSPVGIWKASLTPKLYITLKYTGQESQLRISFKRNGQAEFFSDGSAKYATWFPNGFYDYLNQFFDINLIKDGQYHTYEINCAANPAWKDVIQKFKINYAGENRNIPQEWLSIKYFGYKQP